MNREDIIRMAREAGSEAACMPDLFPHLMNVFEQFAALVAAAAKTEENEACAEVCEALADAALERDKGTMSDGTIQYMGDHGLYGEYQGASNCVAAIRARKIEAK